MRHKVFSYKVTFWIPRLISNWKFARNKLFFFKQNKNNGQLSEIRGDVFTQHQIRSPEPRPLGMLRVLTLWTQKLSRLSDRSTKCPHCRPCMETASRAVKGISRGFCSSGHWVIPENKRNSGQCSGRHLTPPPRVWYCVEGNESISCLLQVTRRKKRDTSITEH